MTLAEATKVVTDSGMDPADRAIVLKRWAAGDQGIRFVVAGMAKRAGKVWDPTAGRYGAWVSR